jgi:hypothetical protein
LPTLSILESHFTGPAPGITFTYLLRCKVRRSREDVVEASGGDLEKCNRYGGEDVCTERYEKDGVFACQVRITKMTLAHEGEFPCMARRTIVA